MTPEEIDIFAAVANLTIAVAVGIIAWAQWRLSERTEAREARQREADEQAEAVTAHGAVWAEWFRLWTFSRRLTSQHPVALAAAGRLDPSDLLPRDWGMATACLAKLGAATSYLGGYAFAQTHDAADLAVEIIRLAPGLPEYLLADPRRIETDLQKVHPELHRRVERLRYLTTEVANLLQDALEHAEGMPATRRIDFQETLRSDTAKRLQQTLAKRSQSVQTIKDSIESDKDHDGNGKPA